MTGDAGPIATREQTTAPAAAHPRISAVVLTLNEEINIQRCIESLKWCDELVVLDSGSSDRTAQIATTLGARVVVHRQQGSFNIAEQRNWCLEHAALQGDWALFLDADETTPSSLAEEVRRVTRMAKFDAYELTPRYLFWGTWLKHTQGYPNWHPRLVRVGRVRFEGGVWEHFAVGTSAGRIDVPYDHYANSKGFSDWLARHDRYSTWDAEHIHAYLLAGDGASLGTARKQRLRKLAARLWPFRSAGRFFYMYVLRGGFVEGWAGLVFCVMYAVYELMTSIKVAELRRRERGEPL